MAALVLLILMVLSLLVGAGCVQRPVGKWKKDSSGVEAFESRTILAEHTYYYFGDPVSPDAIIAIDNRYRLKTKIWAKVEITQKMLDDWMFWLTNRPNFLCPYHGGVIMAPDGRQVGFWYSRKLLTTVTEPEPDVIQVYAPFSPVGSDCERRDRIDGM